MGDSPRETKGSAAAASSLSAEAIEYQLERILKSPGFLSSARRRRLLQWAVKRVLEGETAPVDEHRLGVELFGRPESWDPKADPIVRVQFARLREKLEEYYVTRGERDSVRIRLPRRGHTPIIRSRAEAASRRLRLQLVAACLPVIVAGGWAVAALMRTAHPSNLVAILPFRDLSADRQAQSLCGAFTNELTMRVAELSGVKIGGRTEAGTSIEGSVERNGNVLRIAVQLVRLADGVQIWARNFDATADLLQEAEAEVANSTAAALRVSLAASAKPAPRPAAKAGDLLAQAQTARADSSPDGLLKAADLLRQAVEINPHFALAWSRWGDAEAFSAGDTPANQLRRLHDARAHYARAVAIDPRVSPGISALAYDSYILDWDWSRTEADLRESFKIEPGAWPYQFQALGLATHGRAIDARQQTSEAVRLAPNDPFLRYWAAATLRLAGSPNDAAGQVRFCLNLRGDFFLAHILDGYLALDRNDATAARAAFERAAAIDPANALPRMGIATALAASGNIDGALGIERELVQAGTGLLFNRAIVHVTLGDTDGALSLLEQSARWHEPQILWLNSDPLIVPLRRERRFKALLQRMALTPALDAQ